MKLCLIALFFSVSINGLAQMHRISFSQIDWEVQSLTAATPDSLSFLLTSPYITDIEKVRAIYSWIVQHISYNTGVYNLRPSFVKYPPNPWDTAAVWKSADEMTAQRVLHRRVAVCDGYSRLFKVLCNYAGINAEVITGYGRCNGSASNKFRTNHTWNAVKIDSMWQLLDVTWASGYIDYRNEFVAAQNDFYFLTPSEQFVKDHFPEELRWSLLSQPPALAEFKKLPFKTKNFIKYGISSFQPVSGQIEVEDGDTISFLLELKDSKRAKKIGADPFFDSTSFSISPYSRFIKPVKEDGNKVDYTYVAEPNAEWLHLMYNDDVILRYRIIVSNKVAVSNKNYPGYLNIAR